MGRGQEKTDMRKESTEEPAAAALQSVPTAEANAKVLSQPWDS